MTSIQKGIIVSPELEKLVAKIRAFESPAAMNEALILFVIKLSKYVSLPWACEGTEDDKNYTCMLWWDEPKHNPKCQYIDVEVNEDMKTYSIFTRDRTKKRFDGWIEAYEIPEGEIPREWLEEYFWYYLLDK
jgi:hypothetical protein